MIMHMDSTWTATDIVPVLFTCIGGGVRREGESFAKLNGSSS